jgi:hypothetical protein
LDEGYTPDNLGVAIVDGFIQSVIDIKQNFDEKVIAFAFVRDNIHRAISKMDQILQETLKVKCYVYTGMNITYLI